MNSKTLIKIAIYFFLTALTIINLLIYSHNGNAVFKLFACLSFLVLAVISLGHFSEDILDFFYNRRRKRNRRTMNDPKNGAGISGVDISWEKFIENSPIPAIIFNRNLDIIKKNKTFAGLLKKNGLDPFASKLNQIFSCDLAAFTKAIDESNEHNVVGDATLNNQNKSPFIFYSFLIGEGTYLGRENERIYLAQFVDNSEKIDLKEKFIQAQKMQAVGQLTGGIAHDFNNILTAIIGFCDLLLTRHAPGDSSFVDIMHIKQNANRAANLVRQLLAFSRRQTLQAEVLNINDVLSEISNLTRRLIGENITLTVSAERDIWDIKADKSQLEQVLVNLAVNARDAMKDGGRLEIRSKNVEIISGRDIQYKYPNHASTGDITPGKYVMISFTDSGYGIPAENLQKIFEPFFTTKEMGQGTGLGLATVTGIIEQSDGHLYVSSKENEGTEFLVFMKRYERTAADIKTDNVVKEKVKDLTGSGTILLVEDEEGVRIFSSRALKNKGYKVYEAFSGENALEVIEKIGGENIDLIVSDVVMPGLSGPEFVEQVSPKFPKMKVVFVSGYGEEAFYQKYGKERKFNFLPKPYSLNQLAERVKEILSS